MNTGIGRPWVAARLGHAALTVSLVEMKSGQMFAGDWLLKM